MGICSSWKPGLARHTEHTQYIYKYVYVPNGQGLGCWNFGLALDLKLSPITKQMQLGKLQPIPPYIQNCQSSKARNCYGCTPVPGEQYDCISQNIGQIQVQNPIWCLNSMRLWLGVHEITIIIQKDTVKPQTTSIHAFSSQISTDTTR